MAKGRAPTSGCVLNTDDGVINAAVAVAVVLGRLLTRREAPTALSRRGALLPSTHRRAAFESLDLDLRTDLLLGGCRNEESAL
ncbi:MAG: hypothetical protein QOE30_1678 [Mycobacterium sp.]|jgi:hypothetical protein|nr:hypothetical protein [Mycobacterium sp.]